MAPLSVCPVWREEFQKFAAFDYCLELLEGSSTKKCAALNGLNGSGLQVAVINYESCWRLEEEICGWKPEMIVCDESSRIKNPGAKQSKALHRLGADARYRLILTGTPVQNTPLDFFSQYKFLDSSIFGSSFNDFRERYAVMGGRGKSQILSLRNLPELVEKAHSIAFRVTKAEALDLPETLDEMRYVTLELEGRYIYDSLEDESLEAFVSGEAAEGSVLTLLLRMSQVTGGFVSFQKGEEVKQVSKAKLTALEEIVEDVTAEGNKLVVFARFIPEINAICRMLEHKKINYSMIKGDIKNRAEQVRAFQTKPEVKVFVAQLAAAAMGITLTAASTAVFYSLDFSLANYLQCKARIHRVGQKKACTYIHLLAKGTIDERIMKALERKEDAARLLVDEWRSLIKK